MSELKTRYEISADELEARMEAQQKYHNEPVQKAVAILEAALDTVMESLGVNIELGDIPAQQDALGIIVTENTEEATPQLNGFYVFVNRKGEPVPYAWVGAAYLNHMGECYCEIHWFQKDKLTEMGGVKLV